MCFVVYVKTYVHVHISTYSLLWMCGEWCSSLIAVFGYMYMYVSQLYA